MRLKHIKGAQEKVESSPYVLLHPEKLKGHWHEVFQNDHVIDLEIGMGKGDFLIQNALLHPDRNFIGIEKFDSVLVRAIEKLEQIELSNIKILRMDATDIADIFDREVNTIYLNFSDPWPKNRHEHRRLSSPQFLNRYDSVLKDKKEIIMKTDNRKLFEYSLVTFTDYGYRIKDLSLCLHEDQTDIIETEYEKKFVAKGYPIYFVAVELDNSLTFNAQKS